MQRSLAIKRRNCFMILIDSCIGGGLMAAKPSGAKNVVMRASIVNDKKTVLLGK